ncbi:hypothetical protein Thiofri_02386 [Thiorhodovibrio frisius]|nr:hypothetical protein Thiofri_02386 [Thiorhodovibrio frisius]
MGCRCELVPEGGDAGGELVAVGTHQYLAANGGGHTALALRERSLTD